MMTVTFSQTTRTDLGEERYQIVAQTEDRKMVAKGYWIRRGGCLWLGEWHLINRRNGKVKYVTSTTAFHKEEGERHIYAEQLCEKHIA